MRTAVLSTGGTTAALDYTPLDSHYKNGYRVLDPNGPKRPIGDSIAANRQYDAGQEFVQFYARYKGAVQRIYYYAWSPGNNFDSSLIDWILGPPPVAKGERVAYCVIAGTTSGRTASEKNCTGSRTAINTPIPKHVSHATP